MIDSNEYNYRGLFGILGENSEIDTLTVIANQTNGNDNVGGITGENRGTI